MRIKNKLMGTIHCNVKNLEGLVVFSNEQEWKIERQWLGLKWTKELYTADRLIQETRFIMRNCCGLPIKDKEKLVYEITYGD